MPQSERSQIIKQLLSWVRAKSKQRGATRKETVTHIIVEITNFGATESTANKYIDSLVRAGFLEIDGIRFKTTSKAENWLDRKLSS